MHHKAALTLLALFATGRAPALEITVEKQAALDCENAILVLVPDLLEDRDLQALRVELQTDGLVQLDLPPQVRTWHLELDSECAFTTLSGSQLEADTSKLDVPLWPLGGVQFKMPASASNVEESSRPVIRYSRAEGRGEKLLPPHGVSPCELDEQRRWQCGLPATRLDLRIEKAGAAPDYRWAVEIAPGDIVDLGTARAVPGASISGWVTTADGEPAGTEIELSDALSVGWSRQPGSQRQAAFRAHQTVTDERGFFQLVGLEVGSYSLKASREGLLSSRVAPLAVIQGEELALETPVFLDLPLQVDVQVSPATDPRGEPWRLALQQDDRFSTTFAVVASGRTDELGWWRIDNVEEGDFIIEVRDKEDSVWLADEVTLERGMPYLEIEIPIVPIEGRLTLGEEPLQAELSFGTTQRRPDLRFETDEEGFFAGALPRDGTWPVEVLRPGMGAQKIGDVEVSKRRDGEPDWLDLEMPATHFSGRVVEVDGTPVAEASVLAIGAEKDRSSRELTLLTGSDGSFVAEGLQPGRIRIRASAGEKESPWLELLLQEELDPGEIVLTLRDLKRVEGQVHLGGQPIAGATVLVISLGDDPWPSSEIVTTGADGVFTAHVQPAAGYDFVYGAPGMAVRLLRVPSGPFLLELSTQTGVISVAEDFDREDFVIGSGGALVNFHALARFLGRLGQIGAGPTGIELRGMAADLYTKCLGSDCREDHLPAGGVLHF